MTRQAFDSGRLALLWRVLRHPVVWISLAAHGFLLAAPMPEISAPPAADKIVEEPEEEEEVAVDILSFSAQPSQPQAQASPEPQTPPKPASQPPAPTEENLELQQELDEDLPDEADQQEASNDDDDHNDEQSNSGLPFSFEGNCEQVSGNFDITRPPFWPDSVSGDLAILAYDQLTLFFIPDSVNDGTYQKVNGIDCLKLIARDEDTFVNTTLTDNATRAGLIIGAPERYGGQTLHTLLQPDGVTPASFVTTIPIPPAKVLVLTWNIDPRTRTP